MKVLHGNKILRSRVFKPNPKASYEDDADSTPAENGGHDFLSYRQEVVVETSSSTDVWSGFSHFSTDACLGWEGSNFPHARNCNGFEKKIL